MPYDEKIETGLTTEHMALIYNIKAFCVCVCVCVCACVCVGVYVCVYIISLQRLYYIEGT